MALGILGRPRTRSPVCAGATLRSPDRLSGIGGAILLATLALGLSAGAAGPSDRVRLSGELAGAEAANNPLTGAPGVAVPGLGGVIETDDFPERRAPAGPALCIWMLRSTDGPAPRYYHALAYDSGRDVAVLYGGYDGYYNGQTWEWDGSTWTMVSVPGPSPRYSHAMTFDNRLGVTVLFGGKDGSSTGDTWEWEGSIWKLRSTTGPGGRVSPALAYDNSREVTVLFGGSAYDQTTWEWDGTSWSLRATSGPSPRRGHAMAYDSRRGVVVLFGGNSGGNETWEWEGQTWTLRATTGPSPRGWHALAYDPARGVTVLFGGSDGGGETWEWDGSSWQLCTIDGPTPRWGHALAYNPNRRACMLFGGFDHTLNGETWEFGPDCNGNSNPDFADISGGTSADLDGNAIPDECEDCNSNGRPDNLDIAGGTSTDLNSNGVPDDCEDCNGNNVPDEFDIAGGTSGDCDTNGVPDDCQPSVNPIHNITTGICYPTIQEAIDAAGEGDEIVVAPGVYVGTFFFRGRNITLRSLAPEDPAVVDATMLNGNGCGSVVVLTGNETAECRLLGLTIQGGSARPHCNSWDGGGIYGNGTRATIRYCHVRYNVAWGYGAGIYACDGEISHCRIIGNYVGMAGGAGGGLAFCNGMISDNIIDDNMADGIGAGLFACDGPIRNCIITNNAATQNAAFGGGLLSCNGPISGCLIAGNYADMEGGGIAYCSGPVRDCTIVSNFAFSGGAGVYGCTGPITDSRILDNFSYYDGGAIAANLGVISRCILAGNETSLSGGAMYQQTGPVRNCLIVGNRSHGDGGAAASYSRGFVHSTVAHNHADHFGGALLRASSPTTNSIFWENYFGMGDSEFWGSPRPTWSSVTDPADVGTGGIAGDPGFLPGMGGTWSEPATFHAADFLTVFSNAAGGWAPHSLAGKLLDPNINQPLLYLIADNTDTTITVWGNAADLADGGTAYAIRTYRLQPQSRCVDRASLAESIEFTDTTVAPGSTVEIRPAMIAAYAIGDEIEYDQDGVLRTIVAIDTNGGVLTVDNPLPAPSLADKTIANYGSGDFDGNDRVMFCRADLGAYESAYFQECNNNTVADGCETAYGTAPDCDDNGVPDECQADCNANNIPDTCDLMAGTSSDCNGNRLLDDCDIAGGTSDDCNANRIADECELGSAQQTQKLTAADPTQNANVGAAVAVSGSVILAGAHNDGEAGSSSGAAYVYSEANGIWTQTAKLTADDASPSKYFGSDVAVDGDTAVIGAFGDNQSGSSSGAAYIFQNVQGIWQQSTKITAADAAVGDYFGCSVTISGDTIVVGAYRDDHAGADSGAAYVFRKVAGDWQQLAKLVAGDGAANDEFGRSVSVYGDTVLVGARLNDDPDSSGSAYVFREVDGVWQQIAKLTAADAMLGDNFGGSVSLHGRTAIIGAPNVDDAGPSSGAAYVFREFAGTWQQVAKLVANDAAQSDRFGTSASNFADMALIGAYGDDHEGYESGSAYLFRTMNGLWQQVAKLTASDAQSSDWLGWSIALYGETAVTGAHRKDGAAEDAGAAYVFHQSFTAEDCNGSAAPDDCDILAGTSADINVNGVPDECEPTSTPVIFCAVVDEYVVPGGTVTVDVFVSGVTALNSYQVTVQPMLTGGAGTLTLDHCQVDESRPDFVFAGLGTTSACNPALQQVVSVAAGSAPVDVPASTQAYLGTFTFEVSGDATGATTFEFQIRTEPDSLLLDPLSSSITFDVAPPCVIDIALCAPPVVFAEGGRYLHVQPGPGDSPTLQALRITSPDCPGLEAYVATNGCLGVAPAFLSAADWGTVRVTGLEIMPDLTYELTALCGPTEHPAGSAPATTWRWGDVNADESVNVIDIQKVVQCAEGTFVAPTTVYHADLATACSEPGCDVFDVFAALDAWQGLPYPAPGPCESAPSAPAPVDAPAEAGATIELIANASNCEPGVALVIDAYLRDAVNVRGYQLQLGISGGSRGGLQCTEQFIDQTRADFIFRDAAEVWSFTNDSLCRLSASLTREAVATGPGPVYLGTFVLESSEDAAGRFDIQLAALPSDRRATVLLDAVGQEIAFNSIRLQREFGLPPGPGDADCNGAVDLADHRYFVACLAGPSAAPAPAWPSSTEDCLAVFDVDGDADVDLADFAAIQELFMP